MTELEIQDTQQRADRGLLVLDQEIMHTLRRIMVLSVTTLTIAQEIRIIVITLAAAALAIQMLPISAAAQTLNAEIRNIAIWARIHAQQYQLAMEMLHAHQFQTINVTMHLQAQYVMIVMLARIQTGAAEPQPEFVQERVILA
jgi:hypothetical protein